jgi:hypothetical protein
MKHNQTPRGQSLAEFALVLPIILLITMGIIDFGRILFTYASASGALRNALRMAEVVGYGGADEALYTQCGQLMTIARQAQFLNEVTVNLVYRSRTNTETVCPTSGYIDEDQVQTGDMLVINTTARVRLITPLLNAMFPEYVFQFSGQRTIVENITLGSNNPNDTDFDGLDDIWEMTNFSNLDSNGTDDGDSDYCNNGCEYRRETDPEDGDSDDDGILDGQEVYIYQTNPHSSDTDEDMLTDLSEINVHGTMPTIFDTDGDYLSDGEEINGIGIYTCDPLLVDTNNNGISDYDEIGRGLDCRVNAVDSDHDGLMDGEETQRYHTFPDQPDSDIDRLNDGDEVNLYNTNPLERDTDGDGSMDGDEVQGAGGYDSDPLLVDTDLDGLTDYEETSIADRYVTDPRDPDTDGDGISDPVEISTGTDPTRSADNDLDGLNDEWETNNFGSLQYNATDDPDADSLNNYAEQSNGTNPNLIDSDGDLLLDGPEVNTYQTDPLDSDTDSDTLSDGDEVNFYHSNPLLSDTDGDTLSDGEEVQYQTNPTVSDTDGDGISDSDEIRIRRTNPNSRDTDGDTLSDYDEIYRLYTSPTARDTDGDSLDDNVELNGSRGYVTNPTLADTDSDGLQDSAEINTHRTNPTRSDTDGDMLTDGTEINTHRTDPLRRDTDNDQYDDYAEVNAGANPLVAEVRLIVNDLNTQEPPNGSSTVNPTITLSIPSQQVITVQYATSDGSARSSNPGRDYTGIQGTLTIQPGQTVVVLPSVTIYADNSAEGPESFTLQISNPTNALIADGLATVSIQNR